MATKQSTVDYLLEQLSTANNISTKKMFGEYCLYVKNKSIGLICDDQLFIKPTDATKEFIGNFVEGHPYPDAKPYLLISADRWEDANWLAELIKLTAKHLPAPKPKKI
jgi:DNA transformation protein and related proteins